MKRYYGPVQGQLLKDQQLKNWKFSNEIMLNAIAALEDLAFFYGFEGPKRFEYYSGCADKNNENSLKNAVILQLNLFRCSHSDYTSIYSTYDFPENLSKEEIIKIINEWKKKIPTDRKDTERLFNEILKYLEGDSKNCEISDLIDKAKKVTALGNCKSLTALTLYGNPIDHIKGYRNFIIEMCPLLEKLDGAVISEKELDIIKFHGSRYGEVRDKKGNIRRYPKLPAEIIKTLQLAEQNNQEKKEEKILAFLGKVI